jgi:GxxExxY protein
MRGITYERQKEILVPYKNINIPGQRLDLLIEDKPIVEWKAVEEISLVHKAQLLSSFL